MEVDWNERDNLPPAWPNNRQIPEQPQNNQQVPEQLMLNGDEGLLAINFVLDFYCSNIKPI
jgi:hypothetical protein